MLGTELGQRIDLPELLLILSCRHNGFSLKCYTSNGSTRTFHNK